MLNIRRVIKFSEAFVGIPLIIADEKYFNEGILTENYINKDKIKKKIEELNNYYKKEVYPIRYQWGDIDITEFYDRQIDLLEDLLK